MANHRTVFTDEIHTTIACNISCSPNIYLYLHNKSVRGFTYLTCVLAPLSGHFSLKRAVRYIKRCRTKKVHRGTHFYETRLTLKYTSQHLKWIQTFHQCCPKTKMRSCLRTTFMNFFWSTSNVETENLYNILILLFYGNFDHINAALVIDFFQKHLDFKSSIQ